MGNYSASRGVRTWRVLAQEIMVVYVLLDILEVRVCTVYQMVMLLFSGMTIVTQLSINGQFRTNNRHTPLCHVTKYGDDIIG